MAQEGWRIPTVDDWQQLSIYIGKNVNTKLQGGNDWVFDNSIATLFSKSTVKPRKVRKSKYFNVLGFTALPGGGRGEYGNNFFAMGDSAYWWTSISESEDINKDLQEEQLNFISEMNIGEDKANKSTDPDDEVQKVMDALFGVEKQSMNSPSDDSVKKKDNVNKQAYFVLLYANDNELQIGNRTTTKVGFSVRCVREIL